MKKPISNKTPDPDELKKAPMLLEIMKRSETFRAEISAAYTIDSDEELLYLSELAKQGAKIVKEFVEYWDKPKKAAHAAHAAITKAIADSVAPVKARIALIDSKILQYQKAKAIAAEQKRIEAQKIANQQHEEMFIESAHALEQEGRTEEAALVLDSAIANRPIVAPVETAAPMAKGLYIKETWTFEIFDASLIPREYLMPDEKKIGKIVTAMQKDTNIPGVRAFNEESLGKRLK